MNSYLEYWPLTFQLHINSSANYVGTQKKVQIRCLKPNSPFRGTLVCQILAQIASERLKNCSTNSGEVVIQTSCFCATQQDKGKKKSQKQNVYLKQEKQKTDFMVPHTVRIHYVNIKNTFTLQPFIVHFKTKQLPNLRLKNIAKPPKKQG